jgi:L-cysteine desulfidase
MKTRYLFALLQISLPLFGCRSPIDLKSNCMKAAKIIKEAYKRFQTTKTENVFKDGKIVAVRGYTDNSKSK